MNFFSKKNIALTALSCLVPLLVFILRPLGMNFNQAAVVSALLLAVIWWTTNIVKKIPASVFLLLVFVLAGGMPARAVFSYTLSESFALIALCYLFSYGISKSGLVEKLFKPALFRFAKTPVSIIVSMMVIYAAAIYLIPQPLARLLIVSALFDRFFKDAKLPEETREVLNLACVYSYIFVCMAFKSGDLILNIGILTFAGVNMGELEWIQYAAVPTAATALTVWALFFLLFRKRLKNIRITENPADAAKRSAGRPAFSRREKCILAIVALTIMLWMSSPLHGVSPAVIVLIATLLFFAVRALEWRDIFKVDLATLVFLSAAFSVGGVLKGSGAADIIFSRLGAFLPQGYSLLYIAVVVCIAMLMHMILGSNTTTCSVVIPGLLVISGPVLPPAIIAFIVYYSMIYHAILPFHSVSVMVCSGNGYFSPKPVLRLGIPVTLVVFVSILFFYIPWWRLMGYL
jgi:di/tricarboxylate transporter